ncbi:unnamed protein product [Rotaria socialis]|uniref:molybdopterin molybdotransferase n=1 Tax=Rotaria socialis TaxID=392032 RepID=A0A819XHR9_9BILA|nr:unnamed protein product [Rotaria socialis]
MNDSEDLQLKYDEILLKLCDELRPNLILTTGGTGINSDDMTPEETSSVINKEIPGLAQAMVVELICGIYQETSIIILSYMTKVITNAPLMESHYVVINTARILQKGRFENDKPTQHRKRTVSIRFKDSVTTSTIEQRDDNQNEEYYSIYIYYQLIDNILVDLKDRFSSKNDTLLHFNSLKPFADHLNIDVGILFNELVVVKPMLKNKSLATIIDLYQELYPFIEPFPIFVAFIENAMIILVTSTTCERTFSKNETDQNNSKKYND